MSLYEDWKQLAGKERTEAEYNQYWAEYFEKEKKNYEYILENHTEIISGKLNDIAQKFDMDPVTFAGFIDGINTSLVEMINLDELSQDSEISFNIDFEKLYYNMHDAKADWLYKLPQWDNVLSDERRTEIAREYKQSKIAVSNKVGRNDPCPCGSGQKYKKCCGK